MAKEIIINAESEQTRIAIVENGELAELYIENAENERTIGDICLGRVRKIMPSIQAAFVDIGQKQDAFLHFSDLSDNLPDLLTFLEDPKPEVGKIKPHAEHHKMKGKRRHPRVHRDTGGEEETAADVVTLDIGEGNDGEEKNTEEKSRRMAADARRGQRRSIQRKQAPAKGKAPVEREHKEKPQKTGDGPPDRFLKRDQRILVKIVKEPIASKGSRISTDISLAGRFLVLVPLADYVAVSKKIVSYKERRRLRTLAKSLLPDGFGVIVRTVAESKNAKSLDTDLRLLVDKWRKIEKKLAENPNPPVIVHEDVNMVSSVIRDLFSDDYDRILVDDPRLYRNIKNYVQAVAPHMAPAVQLHKNKKHVFESTNIIKDVQRAFESRVDLPSGGYLFIERTEAMYVIDVNSGRSGRGMTQEENSVKVNLEAARIIAKQTRLRDLGGIIVVDFIDLKEERNRQKVYDELKREFKKDRAVTKILPMSDFGLVQITRQRLRPSFTVTSSPNGTSKAAEVVLNGASPARPDKGPEPETPVKPAPPVRRELQKGPEELIKNMEEWIISSKTNKRRSVTLVVHPFTAAFLNRKVPNYPTRWFMKHLVRIRLETDESLAPLGYKFLDMKTREDLTLLYSDTVTPPKANPEKKNPGNRKNYNREGG